MNSRMMMVATSLFMPEKILLETSLSGQIQRKVRYLYIINENYVFTGLS